MKKLGSRLFGAIEKSSKAFLLAYTAFFLVMFVAFWSGYAFHGKGFLWYVDGLEQQYNFFILEGEWLRELLSNIFINHSFVVPMWSENIGLGSDYFLTVTNTLGNPINLLSVFATAKTADLALQATVPITSYLTGLAFLGYCRYRGFDRTASLLGCMTYVFGGYSMIAFSQIFMCWPLFMAVIVLWGTDKVFNHESPVMLVVGVFLFFIYETAQAYTVCLLLFIYCLVRYAYLDEKKSVVGFLKWFGKIFGCLCLGALMSAVLFLPPVMSVLGQERLTLERADYLLYPITYYTKVFLSFIAPNTVGSDCMYGFAPFCLVGVFAIFLRKKNRRARIMKILFVVLIVCMLLPTAGRIFNGFAYPNNRWIWGLCLLVAIMTTEALPEIFQAGDVLRKRLTACTLAYGFACLILLMHFESILYAGSLAVLFASVAVCFIWNKEKTAIATGLSLLLVFNTLFFSMYRGANGAYSQVGFGVAYNRLVSGNATALLNQVDDDQMRYDVSGIKTYRNASIANGHADTTFYSSFYNGLLDKLNTDLGLTTSSMNFSYETLDCRTALQALTGSNYLLTPESNGNVSPYYDTVAASGESGGAQNVVYGSTAATPMAYTTSSVISTSEYEGLSMVEKQEALLQGVVLSSDDANSNTLTQSRSQSLQYVISTTDPAEGITPVTEDNVNITVGDNTIDLKKAGTTLYFVTDIPAGTEAYFCIEGLQIENYSERETYSDAEYAALDAGQKQSMIINGLFTEPVIENWLHISSASGSSYIWQLTDYNNLYGGKNSWAANAGYSSEGRNYIAVKFDSAGVYTFDSISIVTEETTDVVADAKAQQATAASDISYEGNSFSCTAQASGEDEWLLVRIPCSDGWTATVDGEEAQIVAANTAFMAVKLSAGTHEVKFTYTSPDLKAGACLSLVGIVGFVALVVYSRRRYGTPSVK